jgi:parallel beta-helix repeat protein
VHHDGRIFVLTGDATSAGCGLSLSPNDLDTLEIARRFTLLHVKDVSHLRFEDLAFAFNNYGRYGYYYESGGDPYPSYLNYPPGAIQISSEAAAVKDVVFDGITVEHAVTGLYMGYPAAPSSTAVRDSTFRHIDGTAMQLQAPDTGGLEGFVVEGNHFEDLGFRPQIGEGTGLSFSRIGDFVFRDNTVTDVGHNGVQFHQGWGDFIGRNILVASNAFDGACRMAYDCAGLKFHGGAKGYENVLVMRNVVRNQRAWSYAAWVMELPYRQSEPEGWWPHTPLGELGMGIYMDYASGVTLYRNLVLDNSAAGIYYTGTYREEQPNLILHNTIVRTLDGIHFGNSHNSVAHTDSRVLGNIFAGVENAGVYLSYSAGDDYQESTGDLSAQNVILDRNVYKLYASPPVTDTWYGYDSAWFDPADLEYLTAGNRWVPYYDVATLHVRTPWEVNGVDGQAGEALFVAEGGALPADYALSSESLALDVGGEALPTELIQLLTDLERDLDVVITDDRRVGSRYDAGAFEHRLANTSLYLPLVVRGSTPLNRGKATLT